MDSFSFETLLEISKTLQFFFYVAGIFVVGHGIWKLTEASAPGQQAGVMGLRSVMIGGMLIAIGPIIGFISNSLGMDLTGSEFDQIAQFRMVEPFTGGVQAGEGANHGVLVATFINLMIVFGYWSVGKGMLLLKKTSDGVEQSLDEGSLSAITHIGFGVLLVNIRTVIPWFLVNLLGFDQQMIERLFSAGTFFQ